MMVAGDLEQADHTALNSPALRMALQFFGQGLERALLHPLLIVRQ
jgi:hypothetical protein